MYLPNYSVAMDSLEQTDKDLKRLEDQLRTLLGQITKLREENKSLHVRQGSLVAERASLVAKNDEARTKVEAMINRLKGSGTGLTINGIRISTYLGYHSGSGIPVRL